MCSVDVHMRTYELESLSCAPVSELNLCITCQSSTVEVPPRLFSTRIGFLWDKLPDKISFEAVITQPGMTSDKEDACWETGKSGDNIGLLGELIPEGEHFTLNLKRLKTHCMQQIVEALRIHQGNSVAEKREIMISKLDDMGYEAQSIHVVIQVMMHQCF